MWDFRREEIFIVFTDWGTPARTNLSNLTIYNIVLLKELYWGQGAVLPAGSNIYFQACTIRFKCTQSYCHRQTFWEFQWELCDSCSFHMESAPRGREQCSLISKRGEHVYPWVLPLATPLPGHCRKSIYLNILPNFVIQWYMNSIILLWKPLFLEELIITTTKGKKRSYYNIYLP